MAIVSSLSETEPVMMILCLCHNGTVAEKFAPFRINMYTHDIHNSCFVQQISFLFL